MKFLINFVLKPLLMFLAGYGAMTIFLDKAYAADYSHITTQAEKSYDLPDGLLTSICYNESHWRNVRGQHGEIGICQIKPDTVRMLCPSCTTIHKMYSRGSTGDIVIKIQKALGNVAVDGVYGPQTEQAVRRFQLSVGVSSDGIVGPQTWRWLLPAEYYPSKSIEGALFNIELNVEWAARYLVWLRDNVSDDPMIMAAAYNGGPANPTVRYMIKVRKLF
jgi:hypothetical protein